MEQRLVMSHVAVAAAPETANPALYVFTGVRFPTSEDKKLPGARSVSFTAETLPGPIGLDGTLTVGGLNPGTNGVLSIAERGHPNLGYLYISVSGPEINPSPHNEETFSLNYVVRHTTAKFSTLQQGEHGTIEITLSPHFTYQSFHRDHVAPITVVFSKPIVAS
jgi:hypothetical protein